ALLAKENAAVVPALVGAAWLLGFPRPPARRIAAYVIVWCLIGIDYALVRQAVFGPYPVSSGVAVVFLDQSPLMVRLPAVAALAVGSWLGTWWAGAGSRARRIVGSAIVATVVAGGLRTALRVPVWKSTETVYQSVLRDSPRSYFGPMVDARYAEREGRYADALE